MSPIISKTRNNEKTNIEYHRIKLIIIKDIMLVSSTKDCRIEKTINDPNLRTVLPNTTTLVM